MGMLRDDYTARGKRMSRRIGEKSMNGEKGVKMIKLRKIRVRMRDHEDIIWMKEMWNTVAGGDSEVCLCLYNARVMSFAMLNCCIFSFSLL